MQVVDQLCNEFEREVSQMTQEMGSFKAVFFGKWILKAKQMPLSPTGGPIGRSLEQQSAAGYCEVPWRTCTLC